MSAARHAFFLCVSVNNVLAVAGGIVYNVSETDPNYQEPH